MTNPRASAPALHRPAGSFLTALAIAALIPVGAAAQTPATRRPPDVVRFATFNIFELTCAKIQTEGAEGRRGGHPQLRKAAEILRRIAPDVLLVNEIDYSTDPDCARLFTDAYLAGPLGDLPALSFPHRVYLPVNTGVPSGFDYNNDGDTTDPEDAFGFGRYPGQYGMLLLSRFPLGEAPIRTFQHLLWKDQPGAHLPDGRRGSPSYYSAEEVASFRLSSKGHWDVPLRVGGKVVHVLTCHPTPPVFDGPEDANGRRNFDEIRLFADYLDGGERAAWLVDDAGARGGLAAGASFVLMGDLNADPVQDRDKPYGRSAISQLLEHPRVFDPKPSSAGDRPPRPGRNDPPYPGDSRSRTTSFGRIDYVLPSRDLTVVGSGVFYPTPDDPLHALVASPDGASDHQLVWLDLRFPELAKP